MAMTKTAAPRKPKHPAPDFVPPETCDDCLKIKELCICATIKKLKTQHHVLILQHPQEPDKDLGTAQLAHLALPNSTLKIGLSWRNLSAALGRETQNQRWAVLYLGSGAKLAAGSEKLVPGLNLTNKNGVPFESREGKKIKDELEGIIILDGTWSQAKTLWWRNAWLLKVRRAILNPTHKSLYGSLRKEPRRECLSTIESIAEGLNSLGEPANVGDELRGTFSTLLTRYQDEKKARKEKRTAEKSASAAEAAE
jgi:DTW domain-containing protein YfiP